MDKEQTAQDEADFTFLGGSIARVAEMRPQIDAVKRLIRGEAPKACGRKDHNG